MSKHRKGQQALPGIAIFPGKDKKKRQQGFSFEKQVIDIGNKLYLGEKEKKKIIKDWNKKHRGGEQ